MMRALTLWQPYATGVAIGLKGVETRGRNTNVRGEIAIHAGQNTFPIADLPQLLCTSLMSRVDEVPGFHSSISDLLLDLPHGYIVAVVDLWDCNPTTDLSHILYHPSHAIEQAWGDYSPGRFGWQFRNLRCLREPIAAKGSQGFFFLPADVEAKVRAQI